MKSLQSRQDVDLFTPHFPSQLKDLLPGPLGSIASIVDSKRSVDTAVLSILVALSGVLRNISVLHGDKSVGVNLYLHVIATSASDKNDITIGYDVCRAITKYDEEEAKVSIAEHDFYADNAPHVKWEKPTIPNYCLTADTSAAHLNEQIFNNAGAGLIFDTELDTLVNAFKNTWGNYSKELRANMHNEPLGSATLRSNRRVENPRFAMIVSGTVDQVLSLYPSAENGAFSRGIFYLFKGENKWNPNVFLNEKYLIKSQTRNEFLEQILQIYEQLSDSRLTFKWRTNCAKKNNEFFEHIYNEYSAKFEGSDAIIKRMGLIASKLGAILTCIRIASGDAVAEFDGDIVLIDPRDRDITLQMVECLVEHSLVLFTNLTVGYTSISSKDANQVVLLANLAQEFSREEMILCARKRNIPERTADRYCAELVASGRVQKTSHGRYRKAIIEAI